MDRSLGVMRDPAVCASRTSSSNAAGEQGFVGLKFGSSKSRACWLLCGCHCGEREMGGN